MPHGPACLPYCARGLLDNFPLLQNARQEFEAFQAGARSPPRALGRGDRCRCLILILLFRYDDLRWENGMVLTVVHRRRPEHLVLPLDVRIEQLGVMEMIRLLLPFPHVLNLVPMSYVAFTSEP